MSFAPQQRSTSTQRTVLFWVLMIVLAAVLWQMASKSGADRNAPPTMSYSDFMNEVDHNNIASAKLIESPSTAQVQGKLRQPARDFTVTIPKETVRDLTERLRKQGVPIEVAERRDAKSADLVSMFLPIILLVMVWVFTLKQQQRARQRPPADAPPQNRPLGD